MNTALQTAINIQKDAASQADASYLYSHLRDARLDVEVTYDGQYTVTGGAVRTLFNGNHAEVTFPDHYGMSTAVVTAPYLDSAVATLVESLLRKLYTKPSDMDGQWCCGTSMHEADPELWFFPNEPVHVQRVYRCRVCDVIVRAVVIDSTEAANLATEVSKR